MWKSLKPGDRVTIGDTIRHMSSLSKSTFGERAYEVVKAELHYFEVMLKSGANGQETPERRIIKYIDIGYHFLVEVWLDQFANSNGSFRTSNE
jgi:hypothetical protein